MGKKLVPGVDKISESWVKDQVKLILKVHNAYYFMPAASVYGRAGVADFICCYKGKFIAIETKAGKNRRSPLQEAFDTAIVKAEGISLLINEYNLSSLEYILDKIDSHAS